MDDVFATDPLFAALDPDGAIKVEFCKAALNATVVTDLPGGLVRKILQKWSNREALGKLLVEYNMVPIDPWLLTEVGKEVVKETIKYVIGKTFKKPQKQVRKEWDGKNGRDGEIEFTERVDNFLEEEDPIGALINYSDQTASKAERKVCAALIHHYKGNSNEALSLLTELPIEWEIRTDQLRQFIQLRCARASGLAGNFRLTNKILQLLVNEPCTVDWIRAYALRDLAHYQIQYGWTNNTPKNWKPLRKTLQQARPLLEKSRTHSRLEKTRRSLAEFEAIATFRDDPTVSSADKVARRLELFMNVEPVYGKIRATPLAALYLRANDPKQALSWATRYYNDLQSTIEKGVSLMVQAQAYKRLGKNDEAFKAATVAESFLSPSGLLSEDIFRPPRFSRLARWYSAVYNPKKSVSGKVQSLIPFIRGRLYGPFVVDEPNM